MMRNGKQIDMAVFSKSQALDATPVYGVKSTLSIEHGITLRKDEEIRVSGETEDYQYGG